MYHRVLTSSAHNNIGSCCAKKMNEICVNMRASSQKISYFTIVMNEIKKNTFDIIQYAYTSH